MRKLGIFLLSLGVCLLAGSIGGLFTADSVILWYPTLITPGWNPPNWIFAPVWSILYVLMGIALFLVASSTSAKKKKAVTLFVIHLFFNILWSILFFTLQSPSLAFIEIIFLWMLILFCTELFWRIRHMAGVLLLPYLAWVSFAAYLNYTIWQLN